MAHVATLGLSSCATIAIGGFKGPSIKANEDYKANPKDFVVASVDGQQPTIEDFYSKILYPTRQDLGRTVDMPFELLMTKIKGSRLETKLTLIAINGNQFAEQDNYWPKEFKRHGFRLWIKTGNAIGSTNYIYCRAPLEIAINPNEVF
jgi:hypothetical protein